MALPADQNREIEQLKTLLFQPEATRLDTLETEIKALQDYVGGSDRLELATADVLVAALTRAEVERSRELANAIAPSVVTAIRREIANSREMMVDALYPITGRMVKAAVGSAFKEMLAFIEQRINALTSTELWVGRVKSLATGRPISEFVLTDRDPPRVDRLLMIERGSGRLIADWTREDVEDEQADLLSAMVAAILEFSVQALSGKGDLQKLDFGGRELVLRASPRFILAAHCGGPLRPAHEERLNARFFDTIESMDRGDPCDAAMLAALAEAIGEDTPAPKKSPRGKIILFTVLGLALAGILWVTGNWIGRSMQESRTYAALTEMTETQPWLVQFPLQLDFDHGSRSLTVSGIQPSDAAAAPVLAALSEAVAPYEVIDQIGVVPGAEDIAALRAEIAALQQLLAEQGEAAPESEPEP